MENKELNKESNKELNQEFKNRNLVVGILVLAVIALGVVLMMTLSGLYEDPPKRPPKEVKRFVKVRNVVYRDIESRVTGSGRLSSLGQVDVITEVQGKILEGGVALKKGQPFKKGDLLFRIDDREARLALLSRKSRFLNAIANLLPEFKVDFPSSYATWSDFLGTINIEKDLPTLPPVSSPREKIFLAGRNILSDYYTIKSEEVRLKKYSIYAPFGGTYTEVYLEAGSVANPGARVGQIIRTDKLELEVPIEPHNATWINEGDNVYVTNDDGTREWTGRVVRKTGFIDAATQSMGVFVGLEPRPGNPLYPGMYLKAIFPGIMVPNTMQMPRNAVFNGNEVFVVDNGRLAKRTVVIHKVDAQHLFFSGLDEGTTLVMEPMVNAVENMPVETVEMEK